MEHTAVKTVSDTDLQHPLRPLSQRHQAGLEVVPLEKLRRLPHSHVYFGLADAAASAAAVVAYCQRYFLLLQGKQPC